MSLLPLAGLLLALVPLAGDPYATVSYRSLTDAGAEAAFYRSGGRDFLNQRVHLHVPAARLCGTPEQAVLTASAGRKLVFKNKSVPIVVDPGNVYFRKAVQRAAGKGLLCVKGVVRSDPNGAAGRTALYLHTVKTAPASESQRRKK